MGFARSTVVWLFVPGLLLTTWIDAQCQARSLSELTVRHSAMTLTKDHLRQEAYSANPEWLEFRSRYGENWRVLWRESTGTPHRVYGGSVNITEGGPLTEAMVTSACERFIRENASLLKARIEDLSVAKAVNVVDKWGVIYRQQYRGIEVYGGRVDFRLTRDGTLLYFGSDFYPEIDVSVVPGISPQVAISEATSLFKEVRGDGTCDPQDLVILPEESSEGVVYHLAYKVIVATLDPFGRWMVFVDAHSGDPLWAYNEIQTGTISGTFRGHIRPLYEGDTPVDEPLESLAVYLDDIEDEVFADPDQDNNKWFRDFPWGRASTCPCTGTYSWDESAGQYYGPGLDASLTSKYIHPGDSNKTPVLTFCHRFDLAETAGGFPSSDFCSVEILPNGQSDWRLLRRYTGDQNKGDPIVTLAGSLEDDDVQIRFRFESDMYDGPAWGWNIDDVLVHYRSRDLTDGQGGFSFETEAQQYVTANLQGPGVEIIPYGGAPGRIHRLATPDVPLDLSWDAYASAHERNAYYHVMQALSYVGAMDLAMMTQLTRHPMPVLIGVPMTYENAYYDDLLGGLGFCERFALYADVIYHEYAHAVTDLAYVYGAPVPAMNEGFSDYWACTMTGEPLMGEEDAFPAHRVRNLDNDLEFPEDLSYKHNTRHTDGQIIGGAMWHTRENLIAVLGEAAGISRADSLFHYARYFEPFDFEDFYFDVLFVDEDDSDPDNGTPYMPEITDGFARHGIGPGDEVAVEGYDIYETTLAYNGKQFGDADGIVDPGEYAHLLVTLRNYGSPKTNVTATLNGDNCATVISGTALYGDMPTGAVAQPVSGQPFEFQVPLDGICLGATLEFSLEITADGGYSHTEYVRTNVGEAPVLVVDDMPEHFRPFTYPNDLMGLYVGSLDSLGVNYGLWRVDEWGIPPVKELQKYGCVIWYTGLDYFICISHSEADTLAEFLDTTPNAALFITGQDIGVAAHGFPTTWGHSAVEDFYNDYLKAVFRTDNTERTVVQGVSGDPIGDGLMLEIDQDCGGDCAVYDRYPSSIAGAAATPLPEPVFVYDNGDTAGIRWEGDYKLVYLPFGFEAINGYSARDTVMARVLDWLAPGIGTRGVGELANDSPFCPGGDGGNTLTVHVAASDEHGAPRTGMRIQLFYYYGASEGFGENPYLRVGSCRLKSPVVMTDYLGNADIEADRLGGCGRFPYDVVDLDHNVVIYRGNSPWVKSYDIDQYVDCIIDDEDTYWFDFYEQHQHLCADFNGDGGVGPQDSTMLVNHAGHYALCAENSSTDITQSHPCLVMCPGGDLSTPPPYTAQKFTVHHYLKNVWEGPLAGIPADSMVSTIPEPAPNWFYGENFQFVCHPDNTGTVADGPTDSQGYATTTLIRAAGYGIDLPVTVAVADGEPEPFTWEHEISPKSPDIDASGEVDAADIMIYSLDWQGGYHHRSDMNCDGMVDDMDLFFINAHYGCGCGSSSNSLPDRAQDESQWPEEVTEAIRGAIPNVVLDRWLGHKLHPELRALLEFVRSLPEPEGVGKDPMGQTEVALLPVATLMFQNYPNPMTTATTIRYQIAPPGGRVRILIFDAAGRIVRTLVDEEMPPGFYNALWDGRDTDGTRLAGGVYFCQMKAPEFVSNKRMMLVR